MLNQYWIAHILWIAAVLILVGQSKSKGRPVFTIVTSLYDITSKQASQHPLRLKFSQQLVDFQKLLQTKSNLIIFGDKNLKLFVQKHRNNSNTMFIQRQFFWFEKQWYKPLIDKVVSNFIKNRSFQQINKNFSSIWQDYKSFPQLSLQQYMLTSWGKTYMLQQAMKLDIFNTDYFAWVDGGLMHKYQSKMKYPYNLNLMEQVSLLSQHHWFFHYYGNGDLIRNYSNGGLSYMHRPHNLDGILSTNFFGGIAPMVRNFRCVFENLLRLNLQKGEMISQQNIMTQMLDHYPYLIPVSIFLDKFIEDIRSTHPHYLTANISRFVSSSLQKSRLIFRQVQLNYLWRSSEHNKSQAEAQLAQKDKQQSVFIFDGFRQSVPDKNSFQEYNRMPKTSEKQNSHDQNQYLTRNFAYVRRLVIVIAYLLASLGLSVFIEKKLDIFKQKNIPKLNKRSNKN